MSKFGIGERAPWEDFPAVIRNGDLHASKKEPEYQAAKAGNMPAAKQECNQSQERSRGQILGLSQPHNGRI